MKHRGLVLAVLASMIFKGRVALASHRLLCHTRRRPGVDVAHSLVGVFSDEES